MSLISPLELTSPMVGPTEPVRKRPNLRDLRNLNHGLEGKSMLPLATWGGSSLPWVFICVGPWHCDVMGFCPTKALRCGLSMAWQWVFVIPRPSSGL